MPNNNQSEEVERIMGEFCKRYGIVYTKKYEFGKETDTTISVTNWLRNILTTHGASEYARGKSEERERILVSIARIGKIDFRLSDVLDAINQENTLKE